MQWEYKILKSGKSAGIPATIDVDEVQQLGREGWELVAAVQFGLILELFFKRFVEHAISKCDDLSI